jgi:2-keto-4-pentenoate hydratase
MPDSFDLHVIAREVRAAQDEARYIEPITSRFGAFDVSSGYAVADLIHRARLADGAVPVGRKIGFTNREMWVRYGVHEPIWAHMYDRTVARLSGAQATCSIKRFVEPMIEPEVALHFRSAPPVGGELSEILACIDWIAHAFEIVQSHFPEWKFQAADTVADSGLHGTLLIGEPQQVDRLGDDLIAALERFSIVLSCDGKLRAKGKGSNVLGSPLAAAVHLVAALERQIPYAPLRAGEIVTTGTITAAQPVRAGQTWRTELQGIALPGLSVEFIA